MVEKALAEKDIKVISENGMTTYYMGDTKVYRNDDNGHGSRTYYNPETGITYHFPLIDSPSEAKCWLAEQKDGTLICYSNGEFHHVSDKFLDEKEPYFLYYSSSSLSTNRLDGPRIVGYTSNDGHHNRVYSLSNGKKYYFNADMYPNRGFGKAWLVEDKEGNLTYYSRGTAVRTLDKKGNTIYYRSDGMTPDYAVDKNENEVHYQKDGKTIAYTKDKDGNEVHYKSDGKTVDYKKDKDGKITYNNRLARARFKVASALGLERVSVPDWVKEAEEKVSRKVAAAKKKVTSKTKATAQKKPTKTNGGRT